MPEGAIAELIQNYGVIIGGIGAAISGLYVIYKRAILPMFKGFQKLNDMYDQVQVIFEEMSTNGGTSIKDKIDAISDELVEIAEWQKAALLDTKEAHFKTDPQGNFVWINRTFSRLTQRTPSELVGHGWHNALCDEDRERVINSWQEAVDENRELALGFDFATVDGSCIPVRLRSYKMTDSKGETVGYFGTILVDKASKKI